MAIEQVSDRDNLQRTADLAKKIHSLCETRKPSTFEQPTKGANFDVRSVAIPPITLALPNDITLALIDGGCPSQVAQSLSDTFIRSARLIQAKYESLYRETCQKWIHHQAADAHSPSPASLGPIIESQYKNQLRIAKQLATERGRVLSLRHNAIQQTRSKPAFNQVNGPCFKTMTILTCWLRNSCLFLKNIFNATHTLQRQTELHWLGNL